MFDSGSSCRAQTCNNYYCCRGKKQYDDGATDRKLNSKRKMIRSITLFCVQHVRQFRVKISYATKVCSLRRPNRRRSYSLVYYKMQGLYRIIRSEPMLILAICQKCREPKFSATPMTIASSIKVYPGPRNRSKFLTAANGIPLVLS